jgi:dimethylargininase
MFNRAICRRPGPDFAQGLTTSDLGAPDFEKTLQQHDAYVQTLRDLGLIVEVLDALPGHPDACFVEDPAVIVPEVAVLTNPGADARKGEVASIGAALGAYRTCRTIEAPGTLDGGDVLIVEKTVFVGLSERTNAEGAAQLAQHFKPFGYEIITVAVGAGLHLKSSVNWAGGDNLLISDEFANNPVFKHFRHLVMHPDEVYAGNTLWINGTLITPRGFPRTLRQLQTLSKPIVELDLSEYRKMDGGLTCLSLRFYSD